MAIRIGINGFGRIGRCVGRILMDDPDVELVAVNDLTSPEQLAYLFKYDTVHRKYDGNVEVTEDGLNIGGTDVKVMSERDPANLGWGDLGVDYVFECTGFFRKREDAQKHLDAGADFVLVSAPGKGLDLSVVYGVNHKDIDVDNMQIIDVASCTTNCLAPVAKVLNDTFGIENGLMTTVHAYTNNQALLDSPHKKDFRRGRAAAQNMVPTSTGAAVAVSRVIPELEGKLNGMAVRVPTPDVSLIDLVCQFEKSVSVDTVNDALTEAANGDLKGVLGVTSDPVVSTDLMGDPHSSVVDLESTMSSGDKMAKVVSWYDNEWGFSNRMVDVVKYVASQK
ncbi:type I glyceraldehyde-3-phosphate dehydrogenase [Persicimonas caeni]|uniref:Glyceraldehyde-3-phosphate dehydrogenase n=1 Tax=Persicimonas caeni TaxID=2292766 RepID=A0A4Y6PTT3_PERCE|nr:type I glyceraldehyde-3-phosphate dehydrogenase [Persicimonas caeni]QDG51731.1 type I glyceraldehyde-3-phosphate dehydrogenase [Persicimonas caeni]QED32952.1 type I glyceraldehyde-3-phosphate dehydrogenase [Persicimonas caeni]